MFRSKGLFRRECVVPELKMTFFCLKMVFDCLKTIFSFFQGKHRENEANLKVDFGCLKVFFGIFSHAENGWFFRFPG